MRKILPILVLVAAQCANAQWLSVVGSKSVANNVLATSCYALGLTSPLTTPAINTTGATAIILTAAWYASVSGTTISITDNKGNGTATALTGYKQPNAGSRIYYYLSPTVGAGHTFTLTGSVSTIAASVCITPLSTVTAFDTGTDAGNAGSGNCQVTAPGSPGSGAHVWIATVSLGAAGSTPTINTSFVIGGTPVAYDPGVYNGMATAQLNQASGSSVQPTWTTTSTSTACAIASFH